MFQTYNNSNDSSVLMHFLHGNSITPQSYSKLLDCFSDNFLIKCFLLRPLWDKEKMPRFKNWDIFLNDYLDSIKNENNIIGIGHSIGGNLLLKAAIIKPEKFKKIILLDPTFMSPAIIRAWNVLSFFNMQSFFLPLINSSKNKKMHYNSFNDIYSSYRRKKIFSNFSDSDLKGLIKSIVKVSDDGIDLVYPSDWDSRIYRQGICNDMFIWNNINKIDVQIVIVRASNSDVFFKKTEELLFRKNDKIKFDIIDGDHFFPINNADETIKLIQDYL